MSSDIHSIEIDVKKCTGCTECIRHCPTEAIRVRDGHAVIIDGRCVDCGECIRFCEYSAVKVQFSKLEHHQDFKWKIALPAPSLFGQIDGTEDVNTILQGLLDIGFDDVFEVAKAAEYVTGYTKLYLKTNGVRKPVISSSCPVIARLIALRHPYLLDNLLPILPPVEVAAIMAKQRAKERHPELKEEEIGTYFISPCTAKVSYIRHGFGKYKSKIDVALSMSDIYFKLLGVLTRDDKRRIRTETGMVGIGWAAGGGEATATMDDNYLAADGMENVVDVLEAMDNGSMQQLEFVELNACPGGCVGGVMTIENPFIARARLRTVTRYLPEARNRLPGDTNYVPEAYVSTELPEYTPISRLSSNFSKSMKMMAQVEEILQGLPGINCGACGAPTCRAFAEDVVKGKISGTGACRLLTPETKEKES